MSDPVTPDYECYDPDPESDVTTTLLEIIEDVGTLVAAPDSLTDARAVYLKGVDGLSTSSLYQLGGSVNPSIVTRNGHSARRFAPGSDQGTGAAMRYTFPLGRNLSLYPASLRPNKRWLWELLIERNLPLQANCALDIGFRDDPFRGYDAALGGGSSGAKGDGGVIITSRSGLNGGNWTLAYKLVNGGAIQPRVDLGVAPSGIQHIKYEYYDQYPNPVLNIYINDNLLSTLQGASLPVWDGQEGHWPTIWAEAPLIGQQDHHYYTRFLVEQLP